MVGDYTVDLVDFWYEPPNNVNNVSTWVYAVTVTGEPVSALSHFSLGLETCGMSEPDSGDIYTTTTTMMVDLNTTQICGTGLDQYNCKEGVYFVEGNATEGTEPVVKFETLIEALGLRTAGETHLFVVKVDNATPGMEEAGSTTFVATKAGTVTATGELTGPYCPPTAVEVTSLTAGTSAQTPIFLLGLVAAAGATGTTLFKEIKRRDWFAPSTSNRNTATHRRGLTTSPVFCASDDPRSACRAPTTRRGTPCGCPLLVSTTPSDI